MKNFIVSILMTLISLNLPLLAYADSSCTFKGWDELTQRADSNIPELNQLASQKDFLAARAALGELSPPAKINGELIKGTDHAGDA